MVVFPIIPHVIVYMCKIWQNWKIIHMKRWHSSKPQSNQVLGRKIFGENCKTTMPSSGWWLLLSEEPEDMNVLPPISHVFCVHGQSLTSLWHNQYTGMIFIQASQHPSCGTKFSWECKTTNPSSGLSMLLNKKPQTMDMIPSIANILWVYVQGLTGLGINWYTVILLIQV